MRITAIEAVEVIVPAHPGRIASEGIDRPLHANAFAGKPAWSRQFDECPKWLLTVHTDDGAVGLGETYRDARPDVLRELARALLSADVGRLRFEDLPLPICREYDAFETAVYDLAGQLAGLPVHALLGGAARERVPVSAWSSHRTPDDAGAVAAEALRDGYDTLKLKCSLEDDVAAWARAVHERCADALSLVLDPNGRLGELRHALARAHALADVGNVAFLEDPLPRWNLEQMAEFRRRSPVPVAVHVGLSNPVDGQRITDLHRSLRLDAADAYNINGSISQFRKATHALDIAGVPCWHGSEVDLGVLEAAYVHASAAAATCTLPSDVFGRRIRVHDLLVTPLAVSTGSVAVPTGPGLGVSLDRSAVERFATGNAFVERRQQVCKDL